MESYAQLYGVDWLVAANCLKENGSFYAATGREGKRNPRERKRS